METQGTLHNVEDPVITTFDKFVDRKFFQPSEIRALATPGDILEFPRSTISHFALYRGNGLVTDIDTGGGKKAKFANTAKICQKSLEEVCGYLKVRINNMENEAWSKYGVNSLSVREIIANAEEDEKRGDVEYSLLKYNCEYYATKWRYGKGFSLQGENPIDNTYGGVYVQILASYNDSRRQEKILGHMLKRLREKEDYNGALKRPKSS